MERFKILFSHWSNFVMVGAVLVGFYLTFSYGPWWVWLLIPLGIGSQMLNEYSLHRHIFHLPPPKTQWKFDLLYQAHYGHHDFPTNKPLFFVPPWVSLPILCFNFFGLWFVLWLIGVTHAMAIAAAVILIGGVCTFLCYEWFHMTAHLVVPKVWVERHVTSLHNQHHFRDFKKWFHVSPGGHVIDRAMGTAIDREDLKKQQRIEFIKTLGLKPNDPRLVSARNRFAEKYGLSEEEIERAAAV